MGRIPLQYDRMDRYRIRYSRIQNYWKEGKEDIEQNWLYKYDYNNPYFLANEATKSQLENRANAQATLNYEILDWLKATARVGSDTYSRKFEYKIPLSARNSQTGKFEKYERRGYGIIGDVLLIADKKLATSMLAEC